MEQTKPWAKFGDVLRGLRTEKFLSQADIAEEAGLDQTTISLLERGERQPTLPTLYKLSESLDMTVIDLISAIETA